MIASVYTQRWSLGWSSTPVNQRLLDDVELLALVLDGHVDDLLLLPLLLRGRLVLGVIPSTGGLKGEWGSMAEEGACAARCVEPTATARKKKLAKVGQVFF